MSILCVFCWALLFILHLTYARYFTWISNQKCVWETLCEFVLQTLLILQKRRGWRLNMVRMFLRKTCTPNCCSITTKFKTFQGEHGPDPFWLLSLLTYFPHGRLLFWGACLLGNIQKLWETRLYYNVQYTVHILVL